MKFITHSHRNAETIFLNDERYRHLYTEVIRAIDGISDEDIIAEYEGNKRGSKKSLSEPINHLIKNRLLEFGWSAESPIFDDPDYLENSWRLDFAKEEISVEVAFNHGSVVAWNLLKPVMASELNHIQKAIQTSAGIIICATSEMKKAGNYDSAVGDYDKYLRHLTPMYDILKAPLLIIGLEAPESFYVDKETKQIVRK